jgi:hypothetical protein
MEMNEIEISGCRVSRIEPGIIENYVFPGKHIDVDEIKQIREANLKLSAGKKYVVLVSSGHLSSISKEAMNLISAKDYSDQILGKALLVEFMGHRLEGNFYLRVKRPAMETKIFTDREKALEWLRRLIARHE